MKNNTFVITALACGYITYSVYYHYRYKKLFRYQPLSDRQKEDCRLEVIQLQWSTKIDDRAGFKLILEFIDTGSEPVRN